MLIYKKRQPAYPIQIILISLVDIVFFLLIYFFLTMNFIVDEGVKVSLPQTKAAFPQVEEGITVYVDKNGQTFVKNIPITHERLFTELTTMLSHKSDRVVIIKAERTVLLNKAVRVMDIARSAGAARLVLATEKDF